MVIEFFQLPNLVATKISNQPKKEMCHMFLESSRQIEGFLKTYDKAPFLSD
jgi:hypothetical protein